MNFDEIQEAHSFREKLVDDPVNHSRNKEAKNNVHQ